MAGINMATTGVLLRNALIAATGAINLNCAWLSDCGFTDAAVRDAHRMHKNGRQYGVFLATGRLP